MDWYFYGHGVNDFLVPKDEDLLDRAPLPDSWSDWDISAHDGLNSPKTFSMMDTNAKEVEFDFIDESFSKKTELEPSVHDKDQSSSSSVCGGLPEQSFQQTAVSCDEPNSQLQYLSSLEQIDDIFLDSVLEGLPCFENHRSRNTYGGLRKDITASKFVPCDSESTDWLDVEAPTVQELDPSEQCKRDEAIYEQSSLEESILHGLETVIAQFNGKTRICFRDALYRLAQNTKHPVVVEKPDGGLQLQRATPQAVHNETLRSEDKKPMESETNIVDRAVANLMFNKMEINLQDVPLTTSFKSQEVSASKCLKGNGSKDLNLTQKFHYPRPEMFQGDAMVPSFEQREQQASTESHIEYMQIL